MKILLINGGARATSRTRGLTEAFADALSKRNVQCTQFDVGVDILPLFMGTDEQAKVPAVKKLIKLAEEAEGFVICTPEYHNGVSGALKNALDFLGGKQFSGKAALIGAACGGGKGGINALNNLRQILRGVYALVLPDQIVADPMHYNEKMKLVDRDMLLRIDAMADQLINITDALSRKRQSAVK